MPIDQAGTAPGLKQEVDEPPKVHLKCKNTSCDSILAIEIKVAGQTSGARRLYQCEKCKTTWSVPVGGSVELG